MKVVLTRPWYRTHIITPPIGLGYLASWLKRSGVDAVVVDGLLERLPEEALADRIAAEKPDAVGITCMTAFYHPVVRLSRILREKGIRCIVGGVHPTFLPFRTLEDTGADFVVCGEGEHALARLALAGFRHEGIRGVYAKGDLADENAPFGKADPVENLDDAPPPDWEQIPPGRYPKAPHGAFARAFPVGVVVTTRGCPYRCAFCASPAFHDRRIRYRSPANVVREIRYLVERFGVREIHFEDDNLTFDRGHAEAICRLLVEEGVKVHWSCPNGIRADRVDRELLDLMRRSGCHHVAFGIESANAAILEGVRKEKDLGAIREAIRMAEAAGISTQGFFIFGLPGETPETAEETIRFAIDSGLSRAQFILLDILPGSGLWERLRGRFRPDWEKDSYREPEWIPEGWTRERLMALQRKAFLRFYARPRVLLHLLRSVRPGQVRHLLERVADYRILGPSRGRKASPEVPAA